MSGTDCNCWKWLKLAGTDCKWLEGLKLKKIAGNGWMARMAENGRIWPKMPENC